MLNPTSRRIPVTYTAKLLRVSEPTAKSRALRKNTPGTTSSRNGCT